MVEKQTIRAYYSGYGCTIEFAMALGVSPGSGTAVFDNVSARIPKYGSLKMSDGIRSVTINEVYADNPRIEYDAVNGKRLTATLYDRRYLWKWGYIVGTYNKKSVDGVPNEEKTLAELLVLCLLALDERYYNFRNIPEVYPEVRWEFDNPGVALNDLCEKYGLVVGISAIGSNPIMIRPYNSRRHVPTGFGSKRIDGLSKAIRPSGIILVGNRVVCQRKFITLVAVGEDTDGAIKPIGNLSFAPSDWGEELIACYTNLATQQQRELAEKCVFKWYSIDWGSYDIDKVLPLLNEISEKVTINGTEKHDKPYILGAKTTWDGTTFKTHSKVRLSEGYQVDKKLGIVKFNKPVYKSDADGAVSGGLTLADLDLVAAYERKDNNTDDFRTWSRALVGTTLSAIKVDSNLVSYAKFDDGTDILRELNTAELDAYAYEALNQLYEFYLQGYPKIFLYAGVYPEGAWGEFQSVVWRADENGAETEIQVAIEIPRPALPKFKERLNERKIEFDFSRNSEKKAQIQQSISIGGDETQKVSDGDISVNSMFGPYVERGSNVGLAKNVYGSAIPAKSAVRISGYDTTNRLWEVTRPDGVDLPEAVICQEAIPSGDNGAIHFNGLHVVTKSGTVNAGELVGSVEDSFAMATSEAGTHFVVKVDGNDLYVMRVGGIGASGVYTGGDGISISGGNVISSDLDQCT